MVELPGQVTSQVAVFLLKLASEFPQRHSLPFSVAGRWRGEERGEVSLENQVDKYQSQVQLTSIFESVV